MKTLLIALLLIPSLGWGWGVMQMTGTTPVTSTGISDDFSSDTSSSYTKISGSGSLLIEDGVAKSTSAYSGINVYYNVAGTGSASHYVQADLRDGGSDASDNTSLFVRIDESGGYDDYYKAILKDAHVYLYRVVNGSDTYLGEVGITAGTTYTVKMTVSGTGATVEIRINLDGSSTASVSYDDTNAARLTTGTYIGFGLSHSSNGQIDDIVVDNLSAGVL